MSVIKLHNTTRSQPLTIVQRLRYDDITLLFLKIVDEIGKIEFEYVITSGDDQVIMQDPLPDHDFLHVSRPRRTQRGLARSW